MKKIVLAGGCFWGVEEYFSRIDGVLKTRVGYANGHKENPTYEEVCTGLTGYAEAIYIEYNEEELPLNGLLKKYFDIIDPTVLNRQGPDIGHQYRTGIYYIDEKDLEKINRVKEDEQLKYSKPIVTEIKPLTCFYDGEEYHQNYLKKNPGGYCHIKLD